MLGFPALSSRWPLLFNRCFLAAIIFDNFRNVGVPIVKSLKLSVNSF